MILKSFQLEKIDLKKNHFFLLHGKNEGHKIKAIEDNFKKNFSQNIYTYEESEILQNQGAFFENILSKSFFENEKLIIISRVTDKILNLIEEILEKKIEDLVLILNSSVLEKKSKLRLLFEKGKSIISVPFYEDNNQTLNSIISQFFRNKKIPISQQLINILVERSRGDRKNLNNELEKIENFSLNKKNISLHEIIKLTNIAENYGASELVDHSLARNTRKVIVILNENNYSDEDNIIIIRTLLSKLKKLIKIYEMVDIRSNIDEAISSIRPPIFWKDKPLVAQQIKSWEEDQLKNLIYKCNKIEFLIKKNSTMAKYIISDFIIGISKKVNN
jgi:DNA polymerase-3 subunit delta